MKKWIWVKHMRETYAYYFCLPNGSDYPALNLEDKRILDVVIARLGRMTKDEIVAFMHKEQAYIKTAYKDIFLFKYAESLQI